MKLVARTLFVVALSLFVCWGCNRPTEEDCVKAVQNINRIWETSAEASPKNRASALRSCLGSADKASVACLLQAKTREDLKTCQGKYGPDTLPK